MRKNDDKIAIYSRKSKFTGKGESIGTDVPQTFICSKCGIKLPLKYMHKQNVCSSCTSVPSSKNVDFVFGKNRSDIIALPYVNRKSDTNCVLYELFRIPPPDGWEISLIGLDALSGKPYRNNSRQKSYGAFLGSEDQWQPLSYDEVRQLADEVSLLNANLADLNENTWRNYIPAEFIERVTPKPAPRQPIPQTISLNQMHLI